MINVNYFHKEYYKLTHLTERKRKAKERMQYDSTIITNLEIKPINQSDSFKLFYVPTNRTIDIIADISKLDVKLDSLYNKLPEIAQNNFFIDMLSSELQSTNELKVSEVLKKNLYELQENCLIRKRLKSKIY